MSERIIWAFTVAFLIFLLVKCKKTPALVTVKTETIKTVDTIQGSPEVVYVPRPYAVHDTLIESFAVEVPVPQPYEVKMPAEKLMTEISLYNDTLRMDSLGYAIIKDTIAGKILKRAMSYKIFQPVFTKTELVEPKKKLKLYLGAEYYYPFNYTGSAVALQFKNDNFLKASIGYGNGKTQYGLSYFVKIKLK